MFLCRSARLFQNPSCSHWLAFPETLNCPRRLAIDRQRWTSCSCLLHPLVYFISRWNNVAVETISCYLIRSSRLFYQVFISVYLWFDPITGLMIQPYYRSLASQSGVWKHTLSPIYHHPLRLWYRHHTWATHVRALRSSYSELLIIIFTVTDRWLIHTVACRIVFAALSNLHFKLALSPPHLTAILSSPQTNNQTPPNT